MSERWLRLVGTTAVTVSTLLVPAPAAAAPDPGTGTAPARQPDTRPVSELLTDLQLRYREAEQATEAYNATTERLKQQQAEVARLDDRLAKARLALQDSRVEVGRLARQQYRNSTGLSPYVGLLLARDPEQAFDQGHLIGQLARERAESIRELTGGAQQADQLARRARTALDAQLALSERQRQARDDVRGQLEGIEKLLASLSPGQLAELASSEQSGTAAAQQSLVESGALGTGGAPSSEGDRALRYAVDQIGKPYEWGAAGPAAYDCSGLTSRSWERAGRSIPRTSQEQWARLPHVPLARLRPGDLVVYFPEATHVALYLGDGMVVQAPRPGTRVKVSPIAANPILGAVRPDARASSLRHYEPPRLPRTALAGSDEGYGTLRPPDTTAPRPGTSP
ncbi:C40 family peptidase [Streptomyces nodosus]|uniref:C40 family peptidase n=1 Tax=Streptomyces nodosus TaxID=40318 RepID=UPI00380B9F99